MSSPLAWILALLLSVVAVELAFVGDGGSGGGMDVFDRGTKQLVSCLHSDLVWPLASFFIRAVIVAAVGGMSSSSIKTKKRPAFASGW